MSRGRRLTRFRKVRLLRALSRSDARLLARAFVLLPFVSVKLRFLGYRRVAAGAARARGCQQQWPLARERSRARRTDRLLMIAARRGLVGGTCLSRSLTLMLLLREQGIECDLHIGVRMPGEGFQAHAWVEHRGVVLNEREQVANRFTPIARASNRAFEPLASGPTR
jgi:Transglutaminase-like superfamily